MFSKYAKAWAGAIATLIAVGIVAWKGGEIGDADAIAAAIGGGLATLFALFGPANTES